MNRPARMRFAVMREFFKLLLHRVCVSAMVFPLVLLGMNIGDGQTDWIGLATEISIRFSPKYTLLDATKIVVNISRAERREKKCSFSV